MEKWNYRNLWIIIFLLFISSCGSDELKVLINNDLSEEAVIYAIGRIENLDKNEKITLGSGDPDLKISTAIDDGMMEEAYKIEVNGKDMIVTGGDATGLMYGLLHIKEELERGKKNIMETEESPRFSFRALKFNLPWDSYRRGKALQLHYETCRDTVFWEAFLDMMAVNRFNKLTLWNLHPFNYLVKTEKYPEANGFTDEEMKDWKEFWTSLFRMAKERGIETYLVNWNIFVSPEFAKAHNVASYSIGGGYYIDKGDTSEIVKDYTREAVKELINQYPDLSGLGITLGEGMGGMTVDEREEWLLESFIGGMRMADRKIKFIHRVPLSAGKGSGGSTNPYVERMTRQTLDTLSCVDGPVNIELKFNWSHGHSCPELVKVHGGNLTDVYWNPMPDNYYLAWMIRNEDFFALRWGQPDFIREHIELNGHPWVNGYFVGSETYIPAKDYITSLPNTSYHYAFQRQWMFYKTWGRLLYNPKTPDIVFEEAFESRFSGNGKMLFDAQVKVSRIPLIIASYWNATWDNTLYSEGMLSIMGHDSMKLLGLKQFCDKKPMDPDFMSIKEFLDNNKQDPGNKITPAELADSIDSFCTSAIKNVEIINTNNNNDLLYEVSDIKTWANIGMYFSHKLRSAIAYQDYLDTNDKVCLDKAVLWLEEAVRYWHNLVEITDEVYDPMPCQQLERNGDIPFHWSNVEDEVVAELEWLRREVGRE